MGDEAAKLKNMKDSLKLLSASAEAQIESLSRFGHFLGQDPSKVDLSWNIDEIALQFGDAALLLPDLLERGLVTHEFVGKVSALDNFIIGLSGDVAPSFWTIGGLRHDPRWGEVRALAAECLRLL